MGKYQSIARMSVTVADLTLCSDGTARSKSTLTKDKWKTSPDFANHRICAASFGGASKCAAAIYASLPQAMRDQARSHAYNHIARRLREETQTTRARADRYTFEMALSALHQLDLSRGHTIASNVHTRPLGQPLQPHGLHVQGLREAAGKVPIRAAHKLQLRIHFTASNFAEVEFQDKEWAVKNGHSAVVLPSTAWMDAEHLPQEGLAWSLQNPDPTAASVLFMAVEWRQIPRSGRIPQPHDADIEHPMYKHKRDPMSEFGIFKVAALFRAADQLHLPVPAYLQAQQRKRYQLQSRRRFPKIHPTLKFKLAFPRKDKGEDAKPKHTIMGIAQHLLRPKSRRAKQQAQRVILQPIPIRPKKEITPPQYGQVATCPERRQAPIAKEDKPRVQKKTSPIQQNRKTKQPNPQPNKQRAADHSPLVPIEPSTKFLPTPKWVYVGYRPNLNQLPIYYAHRAHILRTYNAHSTHHTLGMSPFCKPSKHGNTKQE